MKKGYIRLNVRAKVATTEHSDIVSAVAILCGHTPQIRSQNGNSGTRTFARNFAKRLHRTWSAPAATSGRPWPMPIGKRCRCSQCCTDAQASHFHWAQSGISASRGCQSSEDPAAQKRPAVVCRASHDCCDLTQDVQLLTDVPAECLLWPGEQLASATCNCCGKVVPLRSGVL